MSTFQPPIEGLRALAVGLVIVYHLGVGGELWFDLIIGYHAGATNPGGILAHTFRSVSLREVRINGVSVPEIGVNAAIGWKGSPTPTPGRRSRSSLGARGFQKAPLIPRPPPRARHRLLGGEPCRDPRPVRRSEHGLCQ